MLGAILAYFHVEGGCYFPNGIFRNSFTVVTQPATSEHQARSYPLGIVMLRSRLGDTLRTTSYVGAIIFRLQLRSRKLSHVAAVLKNRAVIEIRYKISWTVVVVDGGV